MSETPSSFAALHRHVIELSEPIREALLNLPQNLSLKPTLLSLLSASSSVVDFVLCCSALASDRLEWVPLPLSTSARSAFDALSKAYHRPGGEHGFAVELAREALPLLKDRVTESSTGNGDDDAARVPVEAAVTAAHQLRWLVDQKDGVKESLIGDDVARVAVVAAYQLRWLLTQVEYPHLGNLCHLIIPCALTCLDHWSPEVKGQGMLCFIHLGKNVNASELDVYGDVILDACCQNIASADEIWHLVVEMSVIMVTNIERNNPRSSWFEKMLNEMLGHLERQPRNKERRLAWLKLIEPVFNVLGLVLLAHFRRLIPLFFQWMHVDDDETILLVLQQLHTVLTLTWIRNTPHVERLVEELASLYKNAALKVAREDIRSHILKILILLQHSKGLQFESAWDKHKNDANLQTLDSLLITGEVQAVQ